MNPLLVYLCKTPEDYKALALQNIGYDRYYITNGFDVKLTDDDTSLLNISFDETLTTNKILRLVFLFSSPYYDVVLYSQNNYYPETLCEKLLEGLDDFKLLDDSIAVTREYVALNGFSFQDKPSNNTIIDPINYAEQVSLAMSGYAVDTEYFKEAIKEILPSSYCKLSENFDQKEKQLLKLFSEHNLKSDQSKTIEVYWNEQKKDHPAIIFTMDELQGSTFQIKRTDGLNFYLFL